MRRQSIFVILLLLQVLFICSGCGSSEKAAESPAAAATEEAAAADTEEAVSGEAAAPAEASVELPEQAAYDPAADDATEETAPVETAEGTVQENTDVSEQPDTHSELEKEIIESQQASNTLEDIEDVVGVFEGLEDNHTAIFSFDGAETAFYFEDPAVQNVLYEAVSESSYTLSYRFDDSLGLNVIYKISE